MGTEAFFRPFLYYMIKKLFLLTGFLLFSSSLFALNNGRLLFKARSGSLLIDQNGSSFDYTSELDLSCNNYSINAGYYGASFNLDYINASLNNAFVTAGFTGPRWNFSLGGAFGSIPGESRLVFDAFKTRMNDISYNCGYSAFSFDFTDDIGADLGFFIGNQKSEEGDLYFFFGHLDSPVFGGLQLNLSLPYDFYFSSSYIGAQAQIFSQIENKIADGSADLLDFSAGKIWTFAAKHQLDTRLAFAACNARGFLTITGRDQSEMLYPYSYAHAQGNLSMDFISLAVAYQYNAGRINLSINSGIFINVYSYFNYSYQGQYKTNLFFDGSKEEAADTFSFARADSFAAFDAKVNYSASFRHSLKADFFITKKLILPLLSSKTAALFTAPSNDSSSSTSATSRYLKLFLLSGLSLGLTLEF